MNKRSITIFFSALLIASNASSQYYRLVDPAIGSSGDGNVFIGPSCPFGMVKPGPDCNKASNSGYSPDISKTIYGFSQVHVSGTGGGPKYGNVSLMPFAGDFESTTVCC
jgi:putative alpha-1,2-mannosidase